MPSNSEVHIAVLHVLVCTWPESIFFLRLSSIVRPAFQAGFLL